MVEKIEKTKNSPLKKCVCGRQPCIVVHKGKKMVSCPNPMVCKGNIRTGWKSNKEAAIDEWNKAVDSFRSQNHKGKKEN